MGIFQIVLAQAINVMSFPGGRRECVNSGRCLCRELAEVEEMSSRRCNSKRVIVIEPAPKGHVSYSGAAKT